MGLRIASGSCALLLAMGGAAAPFGAGAQGLAGPGQDALPPGVEAPPADILTMSFVDYPVESVIAVEEGRSVLNLSVAADGHVSTAEVASSSGHPRLDDAAIRIAKERWRFMPELRGGVAVASMTRVTVDWTLPMQDAAPFLRGANAVPGNVPSEALPVGESRSLCNPRPEIATGERHDPNGSPHFARWTEVNEDGDVANILLLTARGWMRIFPSTVDIVDRNYYTVPRERGTPVRCWYQSDDPIDLGVENSEQGDE